MGSLDNIFANSADNPNIVKKTVDTTTKSGGTLDNIFANSSPVNNNWQQDNTITTPKSNYSKTAENLVMPLQKISTDVVIPIVKKVANKIGDWFTSFQKQSDEGSFLLRQTMGTDFLKNKQLLVNPQTGQKEYMTPALQSYYSATTPEEKQKIINEDAGNVPIMKFLNSDTGKKITSTIANTTSNVPLKVIAGIKALGDDTYDEAYSALLKKEKDPNNTQFEKIMYGVQDSGGQSAIGALLSVGVSLLTRNPVAGRAFGGAYFSAISAESQRQDKGKVYSLTNIGIDTVGDSVIGGYAESMLKSMVKDDVKKSVRNFLAQTGKGFLVEGTTEPAQTFLKYANDYKDAKTEEDKKKIVADVTNYVKNGGMVQEFLVGGIAGAGITGLSTGAGYLGNNKVEAEIDPSLVKSREDIAKTEKEVQKDLNNTTLASQLATDKENLRDYETTVKQRPVYISDNNQENPLATVETVKYPDGKFAYSFSIDTNINAVQSDFSSSELFNSQEEAVKAGKKAISDYVNTEIKSTDNVEEQAKLNEIKSDLNTKGLSQAEVIKNGLNSIIKNRKDNGNYNMVEGGAKGDSLKFSAWNRAISGETTETEKYNAKKFLDSAYVGKSVIVDGNKGEIISTPAFGKSKVQFEDGTTKTIEINKLKTSASKTEINTYLKEKAIKEASSYINTFGEKNVKTENTNVKSTENKKTEVKTTPNANENTNNEENKTVITNKTQKEVQKNPVKTEGEVKKSRAFERIRSRLSDEYADLEANYNKLNQDQDIKNALDFIEKNPIQARKIALGMMNAPEGITETAISIAVAEKALDDGDYGLQAQAERSRSLRQVRRGQEIGTERGRFNENSPHYFIQQVLAARTEKAVKDGFRFSNKSKSIKSRFMNEKIDTGVVSIKKIIKKKLSATDLAQKVIDDLTC